MHFTSSMPLYLFYPQILHGLQLHLHSIPSQLASVLFIPSPSTFLVFGSKNFNHTLAVDLFFLIIISPLTDGTLFWFPGLSDHCLSFAQVLRFCLCIPSLLCRLTNLIHSVTSNMTQILLVFVAAALCAMPQIPSATGFQCNCAEWTAPCIQKNALGVSTLLP